MAESMRDLTPGSKPEVVLDMRPDGAGLPSRGDPRDANAPRLSFKLEKKKSFACSCINVKLIEDTASHRLGSWICRIVVD